MRNKKRSLIIGLLIIVCFIIQTTAINYISLGSIIPNLLIIITSSIGFMRGNKEGLLAGFFCGLLIDIFYSDYIGIQAFFYMIIGYCNGFFQRLFYDDDIKLPLILIGASEFIYGLSIYVFYFLLSSQFDFSYYFYNIIIPELIYTFLATIILYQIVRKINNWLVDDERRSASKFV